MKFLVLAPFKEKPHHPHFKGIVSGLEASGHEVRSLNYWRYDKDVLPERVWLDGLDIVVLTLWEHLAERDLLKRLRAETGAKIVFWYVDYGIRNIQVDVNGLVDWMFITNTTQYEFYNEFLGIENVAYLPQAGIVSEGSQVYERDFFFCGQRVNNAIHGKRTKFLNELAEKSPLVFEPKNGSYDHETFKHSAGWYRTSRVNLCYSHVEGVEHSTSNRLWDVLCAGGFALVHWFPGCDDLFKNGKHLLYFNEVKDCLNIYKNCIEHNYAREVIRDGGYEYAKENHTYKTRMRQMLDIIQEEAIGGSSERRFYYHNET